MSGPEATGNSSIINQSPQATSLARSVATIQSGVATHLEVGHSFGTVIDELYPDVQDYTTALYKLAPEDIDDIAQDTFLNVWKALQKGMFIEGRPVKTWVIGIAHNTATDALRKLYVNRRRTASVGIEDETFERLIYEANPQSGTSDETAERALEHVQLDESMPLLASLPIKQRSAIMLNILGYSHTEIAEALGVPRGTIKGRIRLGRKAMQASGQEPEGCATAGRARTVTRGA